MNAHELYLAYQAKRKEILAAMKVATTRHDGGPPWGMTKGQADGIALRLKALRKELHELEVSYYGA